MLTFKHANSDLSSKKFKYYQKIFFIDINIIICDNYVIILSPQGASAMTIQQCGMSIIGEISDTFAQIDIAQVEILIQKIRSAKNVFVIGAGRSKIMLEAFCMRLNHLGYNAFVAGNIPCPPAEKGDLIVAASGSGETPSIIAVLERLKKVGVDIFLFTAAPNPIPQNVADTVLRIPTAYTLDGTGGCSRQLMRTLFEQVVFIIGEVIIEKMSGDIPVEQIIKRHTNVE